MALVPFGRATRSTVSYSVQRDRPDTTGADEFDGNHTGRRNPAHYLLVLPGVTETLLLESPRGSQNPSGAAEMTASSIRLRCQADTL